MDMFMISMTLIVLGIGLIIIESMTPGGFLIVPGAVLTVLGAIGMFYGDLLFTWWGVLIGLITTIVVSVITIFVYRFLARPEPPTTTVMDSLIGRKGVVTRRTTSEDIRGKVRLGTDEWSATSDEVLEKGTVVRVIAASGVHVKVVREE